MGFSGAVWLLMPEHLRDGLTVLYNGRYLGDNSGARTRDTMTNIEAVLVRSVGDVFKAACLRTDLYRDSRRPEIKATAAHPSVFTSGQRD